MFVSFSIFKLKSPDSKLTRIAGEVADAGVESATNPVKAKDKIAIEDNNFFLNLLPVMPNFILNSFREGVIHWCDYWNPIE